MWRKMKKTVFKLREVNSPMKCWTKAGYRRKPGTVAGTKGSCYKPGKKKK
tara:strand:+ start:14 stop:163 length:150 start_codon:yes stop_codon:yes gene_type:complete